MNIVASYRFLRRAIGLIGAVLPIVMPLGYSISTGDWRILPSVSSYYYTDMRNVFVGSLCSVGIFLICYHYQRLDDIFSYAGGALAIGVALCPAVPPDAGTTAKVVGVLHIVFAALFFVDMALMCWFLFTQTSSAAPATAPTQQKLTRNKIYRVCAVLILVFTALAGGSSLLPESFINTVHPLFWFEALVTFTFGVAWWIKGDTLFRDKDTGPAPSPVAPAPALTN